MFIKRILILLPLGLTLFLLQSFFWVPTYDKQAVGNPDRLFRYVQSSTGDAQMLNPVLSTDTASGAINELVFEGLIDLDDKLNYRPRLATGWTQYETAYFTPLPKLKGQVVGDANNWASLMRSSLSGKPDREKSGAKRSLPAR